MPLVSRNRSDDLSALGLSRRGRPRLVTLWSPSTGNSAARDFWTGGEAGAGLLGMLQISGRFCTVGRVAPDRG